MVSFVKEAEVAVEVAEGESMEVLICRKGLIDGLRQFILLRLSERKLSQFKMAIMKPISQYINILHQLSQLLTTQGSLNSN